MPSGDRSQLREKAVEEKKGIQEEKKERLLEEEKKIEIEVIPDKENVKEKIPAESKNQSELKQSMMELAINADVPIEEKTSNNRPKEEPVKVVEAPRIDVSREEAPKPEIKESLPPVSEAKEPAPQIAEAKEPIPLRVEAKEPVPLVVEAKEPIIEKQPEIVKEAPPLEEVKQKPEEVKQEEELKAPPVSAPVLAPVPVPSMTIDMVRLSNKEGKKLIIWENDVIDVKAYMDKHISQADILNLHLGYEIAFLSYRKQIGDLSSEPKVGRLEPTLLNDLLEDEKVAQNFSALEWKTEGVDGLTDDFGRIVLRHPGLKFRSLLSHPRHFGKFFTLEKKSEGKKRSFVFVSAAQGGALEKISKMANSIQKEVDYDGALIQANETFTDDISLIISKESQLNDVIAKDASLESESFYLQGPYVCILYLLYNRD